MKVSVIGRAVLVACLLSLALVGEGYLQFSTPAGKAQAQAGVLQVFRAAAGSPPDQALAPASPPPPSPTASAELREFSRRVANGQPGAVCGLYVPGVLALRVVPQPAGDAGFISNEGGTATQFQKADAFGAIGLLAHNTLAGRDFFRLALGQELAVIYGDGRAEYFRVSQLADYQRLTRADLRSDFLSLDTNEQETADQVFSRFYRREHRLTLQTCLKRGEVPDWGVHFVVADPH